MAQGGSTPRSVVPFGTLFLLMVLSAIFLVECRLAPEPEASILRFSPQTLIRLGGIVPAFIDAGQGWRFFTGPLLHQSLGHILNNGIALLLAAFVERRLGWRWFLLTFAVSASLGAGATYLRLPQASVATGASGGVLGLFSAALVVSLFAPGRVRKGLAILSALVLALALIQRGGGDGLFSVDRVAHVAGIIAGAAMGCLVVAYWDEKVGTPKPATAVLVGLVAYGAMMTASFAIDATSLDEHSINLAQTGMSPASTAAPRASIPVALKILEDQGGERIYTTPVHFGSTVVDSVLDTEDSETQVLPGRIKTDQFAPTPATHFMTYGFGGSYASQLMKGQVAVGPLAGMAEIGNVTRASCMETAPKCPIVDEPVDAAQFGYGSFPATLGLGPLADPAHPPLLAWLGVRRYLLAVPRAGEAGQLLLNPTEADTTGFVPLVMDPTPRVPGSAHGCLRNLTNGLYFCGAIVLDTDRSGIEIFQQMDLPKKRDWLAGDKARLVFTDNSNARAIAEVDFTIGVATLPQVRFGKPGLYPEPVVIIGQVPYLGLEVLTDVATGQLSVRSRKTQGGDVAGRVP